MIKKTISFMDYNGTKRVEDFYFNLSSAETMELELTYDGGFGEMVNRIINAKDVPKLVVIFKDLILRSYGKKSPDGRRFEKSAELSAEFSQTEAYSNLFIELATNDKSAEEFIKGVIDMEAIKSIVNQKSIQTVE